MKRFFKENGHHHCIVMYPVKDIEDEDLTIIWGDDDPTLPLPLVFDKMAAAVKNAEKRADITGAKRAGGGQDGPPPKKARIDTGNGFDDQATGKVAPVVRKQGMRGKKGGGAGAAAAAPALEARELLGQRIATDSIMRNTALDLGEEVSSEEVEVAAHVAAAA
jgi:hypothetical protein